MSPDVYIPNEIMLEILGHADIYTLYKVQSVSKSMFAMATSVIASNNFSKTLVPRSVHPDTEWIAHIHHIFDEEITIRVQGDKLIDMFSPGAKDHRIPHDILKQPANLDLVPGHVLNIQHAQPGKLSHIIHFSIHESDQGSAVTVGEILRGLGHVSSRAMHDLFWSPANLSWGRPPEEFLLDVLVTGYLPTSSNPKYPPNTPTWEIETRTRNAYTRTQRARKALNKVCSLQ